MADPAEFSPVELDRMEDALETLELADVHDEPSIAVRRRLTDYRQILALSRAAMPMVEVPRGLLDNVLAEARAAAEVPVVTPDPIVPAPPSLWTRMRRALLLPGVALATTAALVLLIVERDDKSADAPVSGAAQEIAKNDQARGGAKVVSETRAAEDRAKSEEPPPPPESAAGIAAPGSPSTPPTTAVPQAAPAIAPKEEAPVAETKGDLGRADEQAEGDLAKQKPADAIEAERVVDGDATPRWDIIVRGDRARQKNDCGTAKSEYTLALDDMDTRVKARAYAGLGLCEAANGRRSAADAAYKQARDLDPEIATWIDENRPRGGSSGSSNAARAAKKPKAAPPQTDNAMESDQAALDPFGE
ncbi:MAG TPA: hypothetical protein VG755_00560 [Nannocystaceae bacterium]|nr:hypothetical protein [Nannocystaceae bacterium]